MISFPIHPLSPHLPEVLGRLLSNLKEVARSLPHAPGPCWEWAGGLDRASGEASGSCRYWSFKNKGITYPVHITAWEVANGQRKPEGMEILHQCDHPRCCNPLHLRLGTARENSRDAMERGRTATGDRNGARVRPDAVKRGSMSKCASIDEVTAAKIMGALMVFGDQYGAVPAIAGHYRTSKTVVFGIKRGNWGHVEPVFDDQDIQAIGQRAVDMPPREARRGVVLTEQIVAHLRCTYRRLATHREKRAFKREACRRLGISRVSLQAVLERRTWCDVAPEIPPADEYGKIHGALTDGEVQQIRATWDMHGRVPGLQAALARYFEIAQAHVGRAARRETYPHVNDDPSAALSLDALPFRTPHHRGESHGCAKVSEAAVRELCKSLETEKGTKAKARLKRTWADKHGVTVTRAQQIARGQGWAHLKENLAI